MKKIYLLFTFALLALVAGAQTTRTFKKINGLNELQNGDKIVLIAHKTAGTYHAMFNAGGKEPFKTAQGVQVDVTETKVETYVLNAKKQLFLKLQI